MHNAEHEGCGLIDVIAISDTVGTLNFVVRILERRRFAHSLLFHAFTSFHWLLYVLEAVTDEDILGMIGSVSNIILLLRSVSQNKHDRITPQEHLGDEPILINRLLSLPLRHLCPHLLDVFEHHVGVTFKSFYASKELFVVAKGDEDLCVVTDGLLEDGEGALRDFVLLELADLGLVQLGLGDVDVLTERMQKRRHRDEKEESASVTETWSCG